MLMLYLAMIDGEEDKNKFELLYITYRKLMFYVANEILDDEPLAEDAVQEAFFKILKNLDRVGDINCHKTRGYVVTIVKNTAIDLYNRRKRYDALPLEKIEFCAAQEQAGRTDDLDNLSRAAMKLPVIYKSVLTLRCVQGLSDKEIAKALDISGAAVRKRFERARRKLKEILESEENADVN